MTAISRKTASPRPTAARFVPSSDEMRPSCRKSQSKCISKRDRAEVANIASLGFCCARRPPPIRLPNGFGPPTPKENCGDFGFCARYRHSKHDYRQYQPTIHRPSPSRRKGYWLRTLGTVIAQTLPKISPTNSHHVTHILLQVVTTNSVLSLELTTSRGLGTN